MNPAVAGLTRLGVSVWGSRVLRVRGRTSGEWRSTPVNLLTYEGRPYQVSPRGHTEWVRNLRVPSTGELIVGRRVEAFRAAELTGEDTLPILRAYLRRWQFESGSSSAASAPAPQMRTCDGSWTTTRCST